MEAINTQKYELIFAPASCHLLNNRSTAKQNTAFLEPLILYIGWVGMFVRILTENHSCGRSSDSYLIHNTNCALRKTENLKNLKTVCLFFSLAFTSRNGFQRTLGWAHDGPPTVSSVAPQVPIGPPSPTGDPNTSRRRRRSRRTRQRGECGVTIQQSGWSGLSIHGQLARGHEFVYEGAVVDGKHEDGGCLVQYL
jgi:hypothetical protein